MPISSALFEKLSEYARGKLRQFEQFLSKGLSPQMANHYIKESSSINETTKKGLQPHEALMIWREFNESRKNSLSSIPTKKSDWIRASSFTPSDFRSPFGYKYLVDIKFKTYNAITNEWQTVGNTIGLYRTTTKGALDKIINERIEALLGASQSGVEQYLPENGIPDLSTVEITGMYRINAA